MVAGLIVDTNALLVCGRAFEITSLDIPVMRLMREARCCGGIDVVFGRQTARRVRRNINTSRSRGLIESMQKGFKNSLFHYLFANEIRWHGHCF